VQDHRIGRRYGKALFETALKYDVVASVEDDLSGIVNLLENDKQFREFVLSPFTSRDEKLVILDRIFSDRITAITMQMLRIMLKKRREFEIPSVRDEYVALRRAHDRIVHVKVTSAEMMPQDQRDALLAKLTSVLDMAIEAEFDIDPLLIGGVKVAYENNILDGTARGSLRRLREKLKYDLLKRLT